MSSKRYLPAVIILFVVLVGLLYLGPKQRETWRRKTVDFFSPALKTADGMKSFYTGIDKNLKTLDQARHELAALESQNARLAAENNMLRDQHAENSRLREMLGFKNASPFQLLACRVISRDPSTWWNTVLINRGWEDERLTSDLPVVSPRGLVGKTGVVSQSFTEVILLIDENCKISATTEVSREQGILVGEGRINDGKPRMRMKYISRNAQISLGERVFTSGLGGVFPPGLQLGVVVELPPLSNAQNFGLYREAIVEPTVDLTKLDELFVVLSAKTP